MLSLGRAYKKDPKSNFGDLAHENGYDRREAVQSGKEEKEDGGVTFSLHISDEQLARIIDERQDELVDLLAEKVYKRCEQWYQQKEKRLKMAYNYEEVRQILNLNSTRAVGDRVRNENMCLKAEGRNTGTPFITKDALYTHCVKDVEMDPKDAFELVY